MSPEFATILTGISAAFSVLQGLSGFAAGNQNAYNAKQEANAAEVAGQANAVRQRRIVAAQQSELKAQVGASGTEFTGSPMDVYMNNALQGEIQAQDELYQGKLRAYSKRAEAQIYKQQAGSSLFGGIAGAAGTLGSGLIKGK